MHLTEISEALKNINFHNKPSLLSSDPHNIKTGLYLMLLENSTDTEIRDKNKNKSTGEIGKIVVPKFSKVIKFGKFENGLINRMKGYSNHLHYATNRNDTVFPNILRSFYCLDLTSIAEKTPSFNAAAIFEEYWNKSIENYYSKNNLLQKSQNIRSEYRILNCMEIINTRDFIDEKYLLSIKKSIENSLPFFLLHY